MKYRNIVSIAAFTAGVMMSSLFAANAQDISASHLAAARSAIQAIKATDSFDEILPALAEGIKQQLIANNPDLEDKINEAVDSETIALVPRRVDLETEAATAYAKAISEEDLTAIAAFYSSAAGQSLLKNGAIVSREVQGAASVWQRGLERDLLDNVSKKLAEIAPREDAAEAPAPAAEGAAPAAQ